MKDAPWFWTEEWKERVRRAEEDVKAGRVEEFDTIEDFISSLLKEPVDEKK